MIDLLWLAMALAISDHPEDELAIGVPTGKAVFL
jgi:hypothetical protein